MYFYSTNNKGHKVSLKTAVMESLAPDNGLYMPENFTTLPDTFFQNLPSLSLQEIGVEITKNMLGSELNESEIETIVYDALTFPAPLVPLDSQKYALELWHGPSLAFKDFGARFMAKLMGHFIATGDKTQTILVATSGDTGGAVAAGFFNTPGIKVIILFPKGKVSELQEMQLTTFGGNIEAIEVDGNFDDCQSLVKQAFLDKEINNKYHLSSANSINIARLIPQSFYYFEAYKQVKSVSKDKDIVFSVPSGNFGNLTAGLIGKKMGLPIKRFIAATNSNHIVPDYLISGKYEPKPSVPTISNAMDVGAPSNFTRIMDLYQHDYQSIKKDMNGFWLDDEGTKNAMKEAYTKYNYICDPHGAIGYKSLDTLSNNEVGIFLETAHPAKFLDTCQTVLETEIAIPDALLAIKGKAKESTTLSKDFKSFKTYLLDKNNYY
ncbi:MAG: threonine synthase [Saprospiraceae bacterium]